MRRIHTFLVFFFALCLSASAVSAFGAVCPRSLVGGAVLEPLDLYSHNGVLNVSLTYYTRVDLGGITLYCFMGPNAEQSPTLHVYPGDSLYITLTNGLPPSAAMGGMPALALTSNTSPNCGDKVMTGGSTNLHFHGTNLPPVCHQDEVIKTLINSGETFQYLLQFPKDEPPGLYWYHPHVHGISEAALQGGATGAIIVEGLENVNPEVASLPARTLMIRDQVLPASLASNSDAPAWDLSVNYAVVAYPTYTPVILPMRPGQKQFWRMVNSSADTILKVGVVYDGVEQDLSVIALDGVATGSQDGTGVGKTVMMKRIRLSPASRAEFIVTAPPASVKKAQLVTYAIDTGPDGDNDPDRPLGTIKVSANAANPPVTMPKTTAPLPGKSRFEAMDKAAVATRRKLYFSEVLSDPTDPNSPTNFFITVDGATPTLFDPNNPPAITTTQGVVEEWTIENRALENHEFHIHQIHFLVEERDGKPGHNEYLDTIDVPYWSGTGPYPKVKLLMDFRGETVGDFVYHCHILGHEDSGMMAIIRVLPKP
jgi:FtsP/CotA-like multicopper oxidase with cupredoxin domain